MDLDEPVSMRSYDTEWARLGTEICRTLDAILADTPVEIAHIGSTAVPGSAAKPIIDIQIGSPSASISKVVSDLTAAGFEHIPNAGVAGREYLRRRGPRPTNVHVVERAGQLWNDNILFRDYLRENPDAVTRYTQAKRVALRQAANLLGYSAAKAPIVAEILAEARFRSGATA